MKKNVKHNNAEPTQKTLIDQFEKIRFDRIKEGVKPVQATLDAISQMNAQSLAGQITDEMKAQYVDLYQHIIGKYNSAKQRKAIDENWGGVPPRIYRLAWEYEAEADSRRTKEQFDSLSEDGRYNLNILVDYIWNQRVNRTLIPLDGDISTVHIPRTVRRDDQSIFQEAIRRFVLECMSNEFTFGLMLENGNEKDTVFNVFDFQNEVPICLVPKDKNPIAAITIGGKEINLDTSNIKDPDIQFKTDRLPFIENDPREGITIPLAADSLSLIEQFNFYRREYKKTGMSSLKATVCAMVQMDELTSRKDEQTLDSQQEQYIEFAEFIIDNYMDERLVKAMYDLGIDEPITFTLARVYKTNISTQRAAECYENFSERTKNNISLMQEYFLNTKAQRWITTSSVKEAYTMEIPEKIPDEELAEYTSELRNLLALAFVDDASIIFRMSNDNGKTFHINGFQIIDEKIKTVDSKDLSFLCSLQPNGTLHICENEIYEAAPIIFQNHD